MGRERWKKREYVYLCLAGILIAGFAAGCRQIPKTDWQPHRERWEHLQPVQTRIEARDFEGAVSQYQRVLTDRRNAHADLALFDLGLLYSHYANPRKDYRKSLFCFSRLIREYPESRLMEEAKIWMNLLETLEKTQRVDIELEDQRRY